MILFDVNVLLNAHRSGQDHHRVARELLEVVVNAPAPFAVSELVLGAFVRIATNPRAFAPPTPLDDAFRFTDRLLQRSNARIIRPGERHWSIFEDLCRRTQARGALIADAQHARARARVRVDQLRSGLREVPRAALAASARLSGHVPSKRPPRA